jgi:hypothetical protein
MRITRYVVGAAIVLSLIPGMEIVAQGSSDRPIEVPLVFDHGRLLVEAEVQLPDGSWTEARLWIDTGAPELIVEDSMAKRLGGSLRTRGGGPGFSLRLGGAELDLSSVTRVGMAPTWIWAATGAQANLPATVLAKYRPAFDFPAGRLVLSKPGQGQGLGERIPASVRADTGIVAIESSIGGGSFNMAIDLGASYTFIDAEELSQAPGYPGAWPRIKGSAGEANMWGWFFPREEDWEVVRPDSILIGGTRIEGAALVALPRSSVGGLGPWYSAKTAAPVSGFLGPNVFKAFRVEIDYAGGAVWLEKKGEIRGFDMDTVGLAIRPDGDGGYSVSAVARRGGEYLVPSLARGDRILSVDGHTLSGLTMGAAAALLRGKVGERREILAERGGKRFTVGAIVMRLP